MKRNRRNINKINIVGKYFKTNIIRLDIIKPTLKSIMIFTAYYYTWRIHHGHAINDKLLIKKKRLFEIS